MLPNFVPNFLIGLREGLEASLVVAILVAYLVKSGNRDRLRPIYVGIAAAIGLSLAVGALLSFTAAHLSFKAQEAFGGVMSIIAVGFVTWMVFWMKRTARFMKAQLEDKVNVALAMGSGAMALVAFLAVGREGIETALFLWSAISSTNASTAGPVVGALAGIATAILLAYFIYTRALRLNLARFFIWTGAGLIIVAAGVLAYGIHDLQEAGILPGLNSLAFDVSEQVPASSWYGTLLKGVFNFSPAMTILEVIAWIGYVLPVMTLFVRASAKPKRPIPSAKPERQREPVPVH